VKLQDWISGLDIIPRVAGLAITTIPTAGRRIVHAVATRTERDRGAAHQLGVESSQVARAAP